MLSVQQRVYRSHAWWRTGQDLVKLQHDMIWLVARSGWDLPYDWQRKAIFSCSEATLPILLKMNRFKVSLVCVMECKFVGFADLPPNVVELSYEPEGECLGPIDLGPQQPFVRDERSKNWRKQVRDALSGVS